MKYQVLSTRSGWVIAGRHVHYVGGNLHAAWEEAFLAFGLHGRRWERVLLVGMGASLIQIIAQTAALPHPAIVVLEIDPEMVALQTELYRLPLPYALILGDAAETLPSLSDAYDGIFLDAFVEDSVPSQLLSEGFVQALKTHLTPTGLLLWNVLRPAQSSAVEELLHSAFPHLRKRRLLQHTFWAAAHRARAFSLPF